MSPYYVPVRNELATAMEIETSGERLAKPLHQTCVVVQTFHDGEDVGWMVVIAVDLLGQGKEVINLVPAQPLDELKKKKGDTCVCVRERERKKRELRLAQ